MFDILFDFEVKHFLSSTSEIAEIKLVATLRKFLLFYIAI